MFVGIYFVLWVLGEVGLLSWFVLVYYVCGLGVGYWIRRRLVWMGSLIAGWCWCWFGWLVRVVSIVVWLDCAGFGCFSLYDLFVFAL